jgi:hypothetical protein
MTKHIETVTRYDHLPQGKQRSSIQTSEKLAYYLYQSLFLSTDNYKSNASEPQCINNLKSNIVNNNSIRIMPLTYGQILPLSHQHQSQNEHLSVAKSRLAHSSANSSLLVVADDRACTRYQGRDILCMPTRQSASLSRLSMQT